MDVDSYAAHQTSGIVSSRQRPVRTIWAAMLAQSLGIIAAVALSPLTLLIGVLLLIDSPGPVTIRVAHASPDGRLTYRLEFRTYPSFNREGYDAAAGQIAATAFCRMLRWTRLNRLPGVLDLMTGEPALIPRWGR